MLFNIMGDMRLGIWEKDGIKKCCEDWYIWWKELL